MESFIPVYNSKEALCTQSHQERFTQISAHHLFAEMQIRGYMICHAIRTYQRFSLYTEQELLDT